MVIAEKYATEQANTTSIHLYREGTFWRVYERSAYLFSHHVKEYTVIRKEVKQLGFNSMVHIGFPHTLLDKLLQGRERVQHAEAYVELQHLTAIDVEKFEAWKLSFPLRLIERKVVPMEASPTVTVTVSGVGEELLQMVQNFRLELASPIDCFYFVKKMKDVANG